MAEIIQQRINKLAEVRDRDELKVILNSLYDAIYAVATRLDADAGVTDTSYRSDVTAIVTK